MAYKRKITTKQVEDVPDDLERPGDDRRRPVSQRTDRGWVYWATHDYAKYWYFLGAMFLDLFILLEALTGRLDDLISTVLVIAVIGLVLIEVWGFTRLWGKNGRFA